MIDTGKTFYYKGVKYLWRDPFIWCTCITDYELKNGKMKPENYNQIRNLMNQRASLEIKRDQLSTILNSERPVLVFGKESNTIHHVDFVLEDWEGLTKVQTIVFQEIKTAIQRIDEQLKNL